MPKECVNHHIVNWLEEFVNQEYQSRPDSKLVFVYKKAIPEVRKYPIQLRTLAHLKGIKGIGDTIAKKLIKKLEEYNKENGINEPDLYSSSVAGSQPESLSQSSQESKKKRTNRKYIPSAESGGYAIMLAIHRHAGPTRFMSKAEIITSGQQYCNSSFTMSSNPNNTATAWNSINTLEKNNLVAKTGRPARYTLTEEGEELAKKLYMVHTGVEIPRGETVSPAPNPAKKQIPIPITVRPPMRQDMPSSSDDELDIVPYREPLRQIRKSRTWASGNFREFIEATAKSSSQELKPVIAGSNVFSKSKTANVEIGSTPNEISNIHSFHSKKHHSQHKAEQELMDAFSNQWKTYQPSSFEIYLVVDNREMRNQKDRDYFYNELQQLKINVIKQVLEVGDFCWVAKLNDSQEYIMLNHVVERKKNDDLVASIMDGRFKEQKHRLGRSGVENIIYLVEEFNPTAFNPEAMATSLTQTQILNNFFLKQTANVQETVKYLRDMTSVLTVEYKKRPLHVLESADIQKDTHLLLRSALQKKHGHPFLLPLITFNELMTKTKAFTIGDVYMRQILSIRGVSQDKALAIVKKYPTLKSLYQDIHSAETEKEKIALFADMGSNAPRKLIGPALAKKIIQIFS
ncbi:Crossover junction endonuclease mus81 [Terramyces sp. JEL0728]|nr:Crossover junction endonuclease mus81 [Terramyces sp. JEL0728]